MDNLPDAISVFKGLTRVYVNRAYLDLFGLRDPKEAIGRRIDEVVPEDEAENVRRRARRQQRPGATPTSYEYKVLRADGEERYVDIRSIPVTFEGELASLSVLRDITERVRAEAELKAALSSNEATIESTADGILLVDLDGRIVQYNRRHCEIWDLDRELLKGKVAREALAPVLNQVHDPNQYLARVLEILAEPEEPSFDVIELTDGRVIQRLSTPQRIDGVVVGRVWNVRDVTERHLLEEQLRQMAFHDALTGLANRASFFERLEHALLRAGTTGKPVHVLYLDLDNFKAINDRFGHTVGDQALETLASRMVEALRPSDTAARLGGDEFAFLLEDLGGLDESIRVAGRLLDVIGTPFLVEDNEILLDASVGIAWGGRDVRADDLVRNADIAMYTAKTRGKRRWQVYERGMRALVTSRQALIADLRHALERGELTVAYQPGVELLTGRMVAAEALVRWNHPSYGLVGPAAFISEAEESGAIGAVGDFVLQEALGVLLEWQSRYPDAFLVMGVNVSPKQLRDQAFPAKLEELLWTMKIDPRRLLLEITEGAVVDDPVRSILNLKRLKDLGVSLALDDFGTGYSSLTYLKDFPIDVLKIDQSFISDICLSQRDALLTSATISLGHELGLRVVAEGIESEGQVAKLIELGCEYGQGFLFAKPMTRADLFKFIRSQSGGLGVNAA